jgi:hypothetical protein
MADLKSIIAAMEEELVAAKLQVDDVVDKGKKIAVGRARKNLQNIKKLSQDLRLALQEFKNNM